MRHFGRDARVQSIMIELNRSRYMRLDGAQAVQTDGFESCARGSSEKSVENDAVIGLSNSSSSGSSATRGKLDLDQGSFATNQHCLAAIEPCTVARDMSDPFTVPIEGRHSVEPASRPRTAAVAHGYRRNGQQARLTKFAIRPRDADTRPYSQGCRRSAPHQRGRQSDRELDLQGRRTSRDPHKN